ncbi:hypothetical protein ACRE_082680 [Hapsidospora chrysogenum ATCC 11550]|uniref:Uncharacterized protein n=1 Tax=Hapsidospora chrysogenum (strain ATCC 11550 / CBS 779.69 / DSM 880 / IAM 14645 / JCM 23072 / IMI 49137) TaxID=857340 RepID=A0A086SV95_HAPC1|nr:hypothetical protein ACRE_082680 [Hapsidospora chrysogenum ATCC 11550]
MYEPVASKRAKLLERPSTDSSSPNACSSISHTDHAHGRPLPPWDRTVDVVCHKRKHGDPQPSLEELFESALESFFKDGLGRASSKGYFCLPPKVRFNIYQYLMPPARHYQPITLSRHTFTRDAWSESSFIALGKALAPVSGYLKVSASFRAEMLVAFLSANSFHVVLSPYVDFRISPLATSWLLKYSPYMQNLILELDMTKLGFGPKAGATDLLPGLDHVEGMLRRLGESQTRHRTLLNQLVLLCRRFYGHREGPIADNSEAVPPKVDWASRASTLSARSQKSEANSTSPANRDRAFNDSAGRSRIVPATSPTEFARVDFRDFGQSSTTSRTAASVHTSRSSRAPSTPYYCPNEYLAICDWLLHLRGHISSLRMCGFSDEYTRHFVATLFPAGEGRYVYRLAPSGTPWPRLTRQSSWIDVGNSTLVLDDHDKEPDVNPEWRGPVIPPRPVVGPDGSLSLPQTHGSPTGMVSGSRHGSNGLKSTGSLSDLAKGAGHGEDRARKIKNLLDKCGVGKQKKRD